MVFTVVYRSNPIEDEAPPWAIGRPLKITLPGTCHWVTSCALDKLSEVANRRTLLPALSHSVQVQLIVVFGGGAVNVEPPVADEVLLLEQSSFGARHRLLGEAAFVVVGADVKNLAPCLWVPIVTTLQSAVTRKGGLVEVVAPALSSAFSSRHLSFQLFPRVAEPAALAEVEPEGKQLEDLHQNHLSD